MSVRCQECTKTDSRNVIYSLIAMIDYKVVFRVFLLEIKAQFSLFYVRLILRSNKIMVDRISTTFLNVSENYSKNLGVIMYKTELFQTYRPN